MRLDIFLVKIPTGKWPSLIDSMTEEQKEIFITLRGWECLGLYYILENNGYQLEGNVHRAKDEPKNVDWFHLFTLGEAYSYETGQFPGSTKWM